MKRDLFEYVAGLVEVLPHWSSDDREEFLSRSSAALQALGVVGHEIYTPGCLLSIPFAAMFPAPQHVLGDCSPINNC